MMLIVKVLLSTPSATPARNRNTRLGSHQNKEQAKMNAHKKNHFPGAESLVAASMVFPRFITAPPRSLPRRVHPAHFRARPAFRPAPFQSARIVSRPSGSP